MERDEFEKAYALEFGLHINTLHELGVGAISCDCGKEDCLGWVMSRGAVEYAKPPPIPHEVSPNWNAYSGWHRQQTKKETKL